jgi:hypothetical protein
MKKKYETPKLTVHGDVIEITQTRRRRPRDGGWRPDKPSCGS